MQMIQQWSSSGARRERGASAVEYAAALLVGGLVVTTLLSNVEGPVRHDVDRALCRAFRGDCGAAADRPLPGGARPALRNVSANGGGRPPSGGSGGPSGPLGLLVRVGSWVLPGAPDPAPGHSDGERTREDWGEEDWEDFLDDLDDRLDRRTRGPEYAGDFFEGLGSDATLHILMSAVERYNGDDERLDADELARARRELGPLADMLGGALRRGTLPDGFRRDLLNGDPQALSMLLVLNPEGLPADFVRDAARRILGDADAVGGASPEDWQRALQALGANPQAAQLFMSNPDDVELLDERTYPILEDDRGRRLYSDVFTAALAYDVGGRGHQQAFTNIIQHINDNENWYDGDGGDFDGLRQTLAERMEPYLPHLSRLGRRLEGNDPSGPPPSVRLGTSPEDMQRFLGVIMGDAQARETFNGLVLDYLAEHDPVEAISGDPATMTGSELLDQLEESMQRTDRVSGLITLSLLGQNEALDSARDNRANVLGLYDTVTGGPLRKAATALGGRLNVPAAVVNAGLDRVIAAGRDRLDEQMRELEDGLEPSQQANHLLTEMTTDLDQQLLAQGVTDPDDRQTMVSLFERIYTASFNAGLTRLLEEGEVSE